MTLSQLSRRLEAIEEAIGPGPMGCYVCQDWPPLIFYIEHQDGTKAEWNNPWPIDTVACPNCGRTPDEIAVGVRSDGPR